MIFKNLVATVSIMCFAPFAFVFGLCKYTIGVVLVLCTHLLAIWMD